MAFTGFRNYIRRIIQMHLNLAFYLILLIKLHLGNNYEDTTNIFSKTLLTIAIAISAIILTPLVILTTYIFVCYKLMAILLVKIYLGSKYDGYPSGFDVTFTIGHESSRQIINYIIAVEDNEKSSASSNTDFYLRLKKQIEGRIENKNIPRLLSLAKRYLRYEFYKKDSFNVNDYISQFNVGASREDLQSAFDQIINDPLPKNNEATWEALISKQPVFWFKNKKHHIIIFRLYHTVGDAACGNKIIHALFADFDRKTLSGSPNTKLTIPSNAAEATTWNVCKNHLYFRRNLKTKSASILHNPKMSFHRRGAWVIEEGDKKYIEVIKNIKNRREKLTFNSVVLAGVSLSLSRFCQKKGVSAPETMPTLYAINTKPEGLGAYEATDLETIYYQNSLSWAQIKLPIICDRNIDLSRKADALHLLDIIEKEVDLFKKSLDLQMQIWFSKDILDSVIIPSIHHMMDLQNPAFDVSNLPGSKQFSILGNKVADVIFFTPDMNKFSIGFSCTTYNGRLQLGALVDDATFSSADVQEILEGLIDAFELLDRVTLEK